MDSKRRRIGILLYILVHTYKFYFIGLTAQLTSDAAAEDRTS